MILKRQSTGSPSRYNLHGFNSPNRGASVAPSHHGLVVGPMGAAALNSRNRRDLLVKTRTVKNVLDLDLSQSKAWRAPRSVTHVQYKRGGLGGGGRGTGTIPHAPAVMSTSTQFEPSMAIT